MVLQARLVLDAGGHGNQAWERFTCLTETMERFSYLMRDKFHKRQVSPEARERFCCLAETQEVIFFFILLHSFLVRENCPRAYVQVYVQGNGSPGLCIYYCPRVLLSKSICPMGQFFWFKNVLKKKFVNKE
jgi:hypothetical protein